MDFDDELKSFVWAKKHRRSSIAPVLKRRIWDAYIGPGVKHAHCPLCSTRSVSLSTNSGYEAAHIVAAKYMPSDEAMTHYYLYPSCASCNNECADLCLLDYLFCRGRLLELRRVIGNIYRTFVAEHSDVLDTPRHAWKVLDHLYSQQRFPAGGGIVNTKAIYEMARGEQLCLLSERMAELGKEAERCAKEYRKVAAEEIKPMKL